MERQRPLTCRSEAAAQPEPPEAAIRAQLDRILSSTEFNVPARVRQFLVYVVNEALAGRSDRIKAYSVAVEVFGRDANFDIQNDPVVRIEAGRLRRALERYYLLAGSAATVLIEIPKGGYVPRFQWRPEHESPLKPDQEPTSDGPNSARVTVEAWRRRPWLIGALVAAGTLAVGALVWIATWPQPAAFARATSLQEAPSLVVKPFANLSGHREATFYAAGLTEELLAQLARFKELTVLGRETSDALAPETSAGEALRRFGSHYLLEGGVRLSDGKLRVSARILDGQTSAIMWTSTYDADPREKDIVDIETTIASKVATAVAQPYGVIFGTQPRPAQAHRGRGQALRECFQRFYHYRIVLDGSEHALTRECLEQVVARYPLHATGWAMLSYLYLDEERFQLNRRAGSPPIERARGAAERAARLDPENVRALQALMTVLYFSGEPAEALRIGMQARALNPNDTELLGEFGSRVAQAGNWAQGAALIEEAIAKNPGHSDYYIGILALAAYMQGEDGRAGDLIRRANLRRFSIYHFVAALIFTRQGLLREAAQCRAEFLKQRPGFFDDLETELGRRNFNARDRAILIRGAIQAGFPVATRLAAWAERQSATAPEATQDAPRGQRIQP